MKEINSKMIQNDVCLRNLKSKLKMNNEFIWCQTYKAQNNNGDHQCKESEQNSIF